MYIRLFYIACFIQFPQVTYSKRSNKQTALWASLGTLSCDKFIGVVFSCCNSLMKNTIRKIARRAPQRGAQRSH